MSTIKPKCRYCGTKVTYFGEVCSDCQGDLTDDEMHDQNIATSTLINLGRIES